jgi:hypothetical protein
VPLDARDREPRIIRALIEVVERCRAVIAAGHGEFDRVGRLLPRDMRHEHREDHVHDRSVDELTTAGAIAAGH